MHLDKALNAPMNERIFLQVLGGSAVANGLILCAETDKVPDDHFHPRTIKLLGHMIVFVDDNDKLLLYNFCSTLLQFVRRTSMSLAHKSSTNPTVYW